MKRGKKNGLKRLQKFSEMAGVPNGPDPLALALSTLLKYLFQKGTPRRPPCEIPQESSQDQLMKTDLLCDALPGGSAALPLRAAATEGSQ